MKKDEVWFGVRLVAPKTWAIAENKKEPIQYLLEGDERALLIDTGWGFCDLKKAAESLTKKPLIVANSHCHMDHISGNYLFPAVYIPRPDARLYHFEKSVSVRKWVLGLYKNLPSFNRKTWLKADSRKKITFGHGHCFQLGNRQVYAVGIPGHSKGSMAFLDKKNRLLFTGDSALARDLWLHLRESLPLHGYYKSICKLCRLMGKFDYLLPAHGKTMLPANLLLEIRDGVKKILSGQVVGKRQHTLAGLGLKAEFARCAVIYDQDKL